MTQMDSVDFNSPDRVHALLRRHGHKQLLSPKVLCAALELARPTVRYQDLLSEVRDFFEERAALVPNGLNCLPSCWLTQLPVILPALDKDQRRLMPYMLEEVSMKEGVLCLAFAQEQLIATADPSKYDALRIRLTLSLRPNLWQSLSLDHERAIWDARPDLRCELFRVIN